MMTNIAKGIDEVILEETPVEQAKQQLVVHQTQRSQQRLAEEEQRINDYLVHKEQEVLAKEQHIIKYCSHLADQRLAEEKQEEINDYEHYRKLALDPACIPTRSVYNVMKRALPNHALITKEALHAVTRCVEAFIELLTNEAAEIAMNERLKMLLPRHLAEAAELLEMEPYATVFWAIANENEKMPQLQHGGRETILAVGSGSGGVDGDDIADASGGVSGCGIGSGTESPEPAAP